MISTAYSPPVIALPFWWIRRFASAHWTNSSRTTILGYSHIFTAPAAGQRNTRKPAFLQVGKQEALQRCKSADPIGANRWKRELIMSPLARLSLQLSYLAS